MRYKQILYSGLLTLVAINSFASAQNQLQSCLQLCSTHWADKYKSIDINGLNIKHIRLENKATQLNFNSLDIENFKHKKNMFAGNTKIANIKIVAKNPNPAKKDKKPKQGLIFKKIIINDISSKFKFKRQKGLTFGRHSLAIDKIQVTFSKGKKFAFSGIKLQHSLKRSSNKASGTLMLRIKKAPRKYGPIELNLETKNLNLAALENFVTTTKRLEKNKHHASKKKKIPGLIALKNLLGHAAVIKLNNMKIAHKKDGEMSANGSWVFPKMTAEQIRQPLPAFLRLSKLKANIKIDKPFMRKILLIVLNNQRSKQKPNAKANKPPQLTDKGADAVLLLWEKIGLLKVQNNHYVFKLLYANGKWLINGKPFVGPKTSWWTGKLLTSLSDNS